MVTLTNCAMVYPEGLQIPGLMRIDVVIEKVSQQLKAITHPDLQG